MDVMNRLMRRANDAMQTEAIANGNTVTWYRLYWDAIELSNPGQEVEVREMRKAAGVQ